MSRFGIIGPPALLFFKDGEEIKSKRIVGFKNPQNFIEHLDNL